MDITLEISTRDVATSRLTHHCRTIGSEEDLPVLLLHGSFATSRWWEPFMRLLGDAFHIVAPDLRGCGKTAAPDADYSIATQAADLAALVAALGWDEFELVGHSSGGAIAMEYVLDYPNQVHTLTLVDSAPIEGVFSPLDTLMLLDQMRSDRDLLRSALAVLMPTYAGIQDSAAAAAGATESHNFFEQLVDDAAQMDPAAFTAVAEALNQWNRFADARSLTLPTLLIWGELDTVIERDTMTRTLIAIPGAGNLEVLRNVGHSPMLEAPVGLAERFVEFVTDDLDDYAQIRQDAL